MNRNIISLQETLCFDLENLYCAEKKVTEKLGRISNVADFDKLRDFLVEYAEASETHRSMIDRVFSYLNHEPIKCETSVMDELINETFNHLRYTQQPILQDVLIAGCFQRVIAYKISMYSSLLSYTEHLELSTPSKLLDTILREEREFSARLSLLTTSMLNVLSDPLLDRLQTRFF
jgi:ferritin-like metal-binding protein YciE